MLQQAVKPGKHTQAGSNHFKLQFLVFGIVNLLAEACQPRNHQGMVRS
jgi:hypothetical protein